jgi:hypothetical protein
LKETPKEVPTLPTNLILKQVVKVSVSWAIGGAIGGFIVGQALRTIEPSFQRKEILITAMGWAIGGVMRETILEGVYLDFMTPEGIYQYAGAIEDFIQCGILGAIGGCTTFWQLNSARRKA